MTNPAAAIRALITYAICIPLAMAVGWLLCNPLDYGTLGFFGLIGLLIISPIFIKWHYPILVFGIGCPAYCFFLMGNPPLLQVVVILSLGIAIVDRAMNSEKRFVSPAVMTWPILFTIAMVYATAELRGGVGLKAFGGELAGGKKYIALFIGCAMFFALTSRYIPKEKRNLYVALFFLAGTPQFFSDLFPVLPAPLNYINLVFPPSEAATQKDFTLGSSRLGAVAASAGIVANFMIAKFGLRGLLRSDRPNRTLLFGLLMLLTFLGGFRIVLVTYLMVGTMLFFIEGLHRTRLLPVALLGLVMSGAFLVGFSDKLPATFQRTLSFLPLKFDSEVLLDADGSKEWREQMWRDVWPKVPDYLLLGKGYALTKDDFAMMGDGQFSNGIQSKLDASMGSLAISGDYHNGPLSTLMPFGIWGAISLLWIGFAGLFVMYRNYRYGDEDLKNVNTFLLVIFLNRFIGFFFLFGAYSNDIGEFGKLAGFSIALNWGVCKPKAVAAVVPRIKKIIPQRQPARLPAHA
jgi:hypothetical protein